MAFPIPPDNRQPIPNSPFYYPETNYLKGEYGPFIVGGGIFIDNLTGTISAGGSGPGGVSTIHPGSGIFVSSNVGGIVTVTNTGVLSLTGGGGIAITGSGGNLVITNTAPAGGSGTVTSVTAGAGLTGGTITTSGTIALATTSVAPATYSNPTITVDQYGRITFASPGSSFAGGITASGPLAVTSTFPQNVSIQSASTAASGAVQLNDTVTSSSTSQAATARAVQEAYSLASSLSGSSTLALNTANTAKATADSALSIAQNAIPKATFSTKGQILSGIGPSQWVALPVGSNGRVLSANSTCVSGLEWVTPATGSGTVTSVVAGTGLTGGNITVSGTIGLATTGVSPGLYTYASVSVDAQGRIVTAASGTAPSTTVVNPLVNTGTAIAPVLSLASTAVVPGNYSNASFTVDAKGRLTAASSGTPPVTAISVVSPATNLGTSLAPNISVQTATTGQLGAVRIGTNIDVSTGIISVKSSSTTQSGIVQLNNTLSSTSTTQALTAAQGKALQDQITGLVTSSNLTLAGTFNASTSQMLTVTSDGSSAGFTVGANLPAAAVGNTDYFVIVTTGGTYNPPSGSGPYNATQGDWFLSTGTAWEYLNVGLDLPVASTGSSGIVELATVAETQAGTSTALAITPSGAAATYLPLTFLTAKGTLVSATGANVPTAVSVGTDGQFLVACNASASGLCWATLVSPNATPTSAGVVFGCTTVNNSSLGCNALLSVTTGTLNTALGVGAGFSYTSTNCATAVGANALCSATSGDSNTALGSFAGKNITTGALNVVIGSNVDVPSSTGSCQLALGYDSNQYWLTGDSNKHIQPGAGIRDCAGNLGTAGQVLRSTGSAIQWATPSNSVISLSLGGSATVGDNQQLVPYWDCAYALNPPAGVTVGTAFNGCDRAAVTFPIGCRLRIDYSLTTSIYENSSAGTGVEIRSSIVNNGTGLAVANSLSYWGGTFGGNTNTSNQMSQAFYFTTSAGNCSFAMQINKSTPPGWVWKTYAGYGNWTFTFLN